MEEGRGSAMLKRGKVLFATIALLCINMIGLSVSEEEKVSLLTDLVDAVMPGTVYIQTYDSDDRQMSAGSGFFINDEGYVVTCNHVVEDETGNCNLTRKFAYAKVTTSDSKQYAALPIIYDPEGDLVLCKLVDADISDSPVQALPISTSYPKVGEDIFVIGAPENNRFSVTKGIISSISRKLSELPHLKTAFQIDASVLPGSSGGPVFNMDGEIVGIVRSTEGPGVNFVIPAERIEDLMKQSKPSASAPARDFDITFDDIIIQDPNPFVPQIQVQETGDGHFVISAFIEHRNETALAKIDPFGRTEWFRIFPDCEITSIQATDNGGFILAGGRKVPNSDDVEAELIKVDSKGDEMWTRSFGEPHEKMGFLSVQETRDDGYLLAGGRMDHKGTNWDGFLIKTDPNGEEEWSKKLGEPEDNDIILSARNTIDGGFVLLKVYDSKGSDFRGSLTKVDSEGNVMWNRTYDDFLDEEDRHRICIYSAEVTDDGGFILTGGLQSDDSYSSESGLLIKTDEYGCPVWSRAYFGLGFNDFRRSCFFSIQETNDGGFILAGYRDSEEHSSDGWIMKTDSSGNEMWNKTLGESKSDMILSAKETDDGGYILAGATSSYRETLIDDDPVMWLIKLEG